MRWTALVLIGCTTGEGTHDDADDNGGDDGGGPDTDTTSDTDTDTDTTTTGGCPTDVVTATDAISDPTCVNTLATADLTPVLEWSFDTWTTWSNSKSVIAPPIVASLTDDDHDGDIDADDIPDIVIVAYDWAFWGGSPVFRALSGDGSGELWTYDEGLFQFEGGAAAGDLDGDGVVEIVIVHTNFTLTALKADGTALWTSEPAPFGHWTQYADVPLIADLDHDGSPEIVVGNTIWDANGVLIGTGTHGYAQSSYYGSFPTSADLDGDGVDEVLGGNAAYEMDGSDLWYNGELPGFPAVADLDLDGDPEIVITGQDQIRIEDHEGNVVKEDALANDIGADRGGPPVIADFDGDGAPEIGVAETSLFTVYEADLSVLWSAPMQDNSSGIVGATAFDFDGDGSAEVVFADETALWVLSGKDGSVRAELPHNSVTWVEFPVVADVDGDHSAEIVLPNNGGGMYGIDVYGDADGNWPAGREIWNEGAYHVTNVNDDGTIPTDPEPSWEHLNTFRSADLTAGDGLAASDLAVTVVDVCEAECDQDRLVLRVITTNFGATDVRVPVRYTVYAVNGGSRTEVAEGDGPTSLAPGARADSDTIIVAGLASADSIVVRVDSDEGDCHPENDEVEVVGPFCE